MALSVKRITLWRREVPNETGALDALADAGADLRLVRAITAPPL